MYLVLNRVAKWTIFVLIGQGLKASAAHLYQDFPWVHPRPPGERYLPFFYIIASW